MLISFKKMAVPYEALREVWRGLVASFLNKDIKFDFSLQHIQTAFSELGMSNFK